MCNLVFERSAVIDLMGVISSKSIMSFSRLAFISGNIQPGWSLSVLIQGFTLLQPLSMDDYAPVGARHCEILPPCFCRATLKVLMYRSHVAA